MEPKLTEIIGGLAFPESPVWLPDGSLIIVELAAGAISRVTLNDLFAATANRNAIREPALQK